MDKTRLRVRSPGQKCSDPHGDRYFELRAANLYRLDLPGGELRDAQFVPTRCLPQIDHLSESEHALYTRDYADFE